jgi:chromosome partitioning protein
MHIITIAAQKGGVGKTTLAVNLAVTAEYAGIRTAIADLDSQESATAWHERRLANEHRLPNAVDGDMPHVEPLSARRLPAWLTAARAAGFGLAILDTPPAASNEAAEAVRLSDLVLIPCRPSLIDLDAIRRTAHLIATAAKQAFVVLNAAPVSARALLEDASELAGAAGLACAPVVVRERSAFRHAWPQGLAVGEFEPGGKAMQEIAALHNFMLATMQTVTPSTIQP